MDPEELKRILKAIASGLARSVNDPEQYVLGGAERALALGETVAGTQMNLARRAGLPVPGEEGRAAIRERLRGVSVPDEPGEGTGRLLGGGLFEGTLGRLAGPTKLARAIGGAAVGSGVAAAGPEESSAAFLSQASRETSPGLSDLFGGISESPVGRAAFEGAVSLAGEGVVEGLARGLRGLRGGPPSAPTPQLAREADELRVPIESPKVQPGPTKVLRDELDATERAMNAARAGEIDPHEFINLEKFGPLSPDAQTRLLDATRSAVAERGLSPKEVVPNKETMAKALGVSPEDIAETPAKRLNGVEMLAVRNHVASNVEEIERQAKRLATPDGKTAEEAVNIITELEAENDFLLGKFVKARSEAGRNLQSLKILANNTLDPFAWEVKAKTLLGPRPLTDEITSNIRRLTKEGDRAGLAEYVAGLREPSKGEKLATLWKAGLLTSPTTHMANFTGNTTMAFLESVKDVPAVAFDRLMGAFTGLETKALSGGTFTAPAKAGAKAAKRSGLGLLDDVIESARTGTPRPLGRNPVTAAELRKADLPRRVRFNNAFLDAYTNSVFRALSESDQVFSSAALARSIDEQARLMVKKEGLEGAERAARIADLRLNPTDEMSVRAIQDAEFATFRDKTKLGSTVARLKQAAGTPSEFVVPFTSTPSSIATKVATDYTGVKAVWEIVQGARKGITDESQRKIVEALGRGATGWGLIGAGWTLAENGLASGPLPDDPSERSTFFLTGKVPNAVLVDGEWRSMERVSPGGNLLMVGAEFHRIFNDPELSAGGKTVAAARAPFGMLLEQPFLTGTKQLLDIATDPEPQRLNRLGGEFASSGVPNVVRAIARGVDPTIRETEGVGQAVQASIPGLSQSLPERLDQFGEPIVRPQGVGGQLIDLFRSSPDKRDDPVLAEIDRVGARIGSRRRERETESPETFNRFVGAEGPILRAAVEMTVNAPDYAAMSDEQKKEAIEDAVTSVRRGVSDLRKLLQLSQAVNE